MMMQEQWNCKNLSSKKAQIRELKCILSHHAKGATFGFVGINSLQNKPQF